MLYHLSLEKLKLWRVGLVACDIPHLRGWMGLVSAFPLPVQDCRCCPGKLGEPSWVLTKGYPKICLSESNPAGAGCPCRGGSLSLLLYVPSSLRRRRAIPRLEDPISLWGWLAIQRASAVWAGAYEAPAVSRYAFVCFAAAGQQLPPLST